MPAPKEPLTRIGHDPDAFQACYRNHLEAVQRFVARRVDDPHLAVDLTAEVFFAAIDSAHAYTPGRGPVIAWLYGAGRNTIAAEVRRRSRELAAASRISGHRLLDPASLARIDGLSDDDRKLPELGLAGRPVGRQSGPEPWGEASHRARPPGSW